MATFDDEADEPTPDENDPGLEGTDSTEDTNSELEAGETKAEKNPTTVDAAEEVRRAISNVYTFVRSQETNKTIASYTFDHYIQEAKDRIKGGVGVDVNGITQVGRAIRDAAGQAFDVRPPKLEALAALEASFNKQFDKAKQLALAADKKASSGSSG